MVDLPINAVLNHLLKQQDWARARLRPYADKVVLFRMAPLPDVRLRILGTGYVESAAEDVTADLTVSIKSSAIPHLLARDESAMAGVELSGPVDLASTVQLLFRELRWDAEEDLSRITGDVVAHRVAGAVRDLVAWQKDAAKRLSQNMAEYLTEERPVLAPRADMQDLRRSLAILEEDCTRLERRIEALETRARRTRA